VVLNLTVTREDIAPSAQNIDIVVGSFQYFVTTCPVKNLLNYYSYSYSSRIGLLSLPDSELILKL
jgi:hypothetical protein